MSRFINSSANYSETNVLKSKLLYPILEQFNEYTSLAKSSKSNFSIPVQYIIPNNQIKYFLLIVNKNAITSNSSNSRYKICYFFPIDSKSNTHTDFYVELDNDKTSFSNNTYLFEGYMYPETFLITDVLAIDNEIIKCNYSLRYSLIQKIIYNQHLENLNGHLNINIHSTFEIQDENHAQQLLHIFKNNFVFKNYINAVEYVDENYYSKQQKIIFNEYISTPQLKNIAKTKYIDVYEVRNIETNDKENILYVQTINDSVKLRKLFENEDKNINILCTYNDNFKKWQPVF